MATATALAMTDRELSQLTAYIGSVTGINLDASKRYLIEGRLSAVAAEMGCSSFDALYQRAKADRSVERRVIEAISTNETSFFRDRKVFDLLKQKLVPDLLGTSISKPVSIWSAASSTGQEAYSIAIALEQILFDLAKTNLRIRGTDISEKVVNHANKGEYSQLEVGRGLEPKELMKYFNRVGDVFRVRDDLRLVTRFAVDNLLAPQTSGPFDIILCRNVLIYFAPQDKAKVVANLVRRLKPGGVLVLGATESLVGIDPRLRRAEFRGVGYLVLDC